MSSSTRTRPFPRLATLALALLLAHQPARAANASDGPVFRAGPSLAAGTGPVGVAAADFDADGRPDLAVANSGSGDVSVRTYE